MCWGRAHPAFAELNGWVVLTQLKAETGYLHIQIVTLSILLYQRTCHGGSEEKIRITAVTIVLTIVCKQGLA